MAYTTIDDPSEYFQTKIYTGTGSSLALTNDGNSDLQPDFVWIKGRDFADSHHLTNTSVGLGKHLRSNTNGAEYTNAQVVTAVASDGFTVGSDAGVNTNNKLHVAWQWKANGGTTASNTDGDITSTVQANTEAGFSIVTYTGNGSGSDQTVGHGLGSTCKLVLLKILTDAGESWRVYHESVSAAAGGTLFLNDTAAVDAGDNGGDPARIKSTNDSTITLLSYTNTYNAVNASGKNYLAYCFAEKQGYSKIGTYIGNGSTDGSFVNTGFKPAFILFKQTAATGGWTMKDNARSPANPAIARVLADDNPIENTGADVDFLSNGFKLRSASNAVNETQKYIYLAFAESPFVSSTGTPTTAR